MDDISWDDLDPEEQRAIALLGAGFSVELCDRVAVLTLKRVGLVRGSGLTRAAEQLRRKAIRRQLRAVEFRAALHDRYKKKPQLGRRSQMLSSNQPFRVKENRPLEPCIKIPLHRRVGWEVLGQLPPLATGGRNVEDRIYHRPHVCCTWTPEG